MRSSSPRRLHGLEAARRTRRSTSGARRRRHRRGHPSRLRPGRSARDQSPEVQPRLERPRPTCSSRHGSHPGPRIPGKLAVHVGRAFAASPESSAPLAADGPPRRLLFSLSYRGHLRGGRRRWRPDSLTARRFWPRSPCWRDPSDAPVRTFASGSCRRHRWLAQWAPLLGLARGLAPVTAVPAAFRFGREVEAEPVAPRKGLFGSEAARAYLALVRRDTAAALRRFENIPDSLCLTCFSESLTRLVLGSTRRVDRRVLDAQGLGRASRPRLR